MAHLTQMPGTHITHFLEKLEEHKIPLQFIRRYRLDTDFAKKMSGLIISEHLENPGEKIIVKMDRSLSRSQLMQPFKKASCFVLREDVIESLGLDAALPDSAKKPAVRISIAETTEFFLVPLHIDTNEQEAELILREMNLESVSVEESLTVAAQAWNCIFKRYSSVVVLSGQYIGPVKEFQNHFLSFGVTMDGHYSIGLTKNSFSPKTKFLVKKKKIAIQEKK
jgi:hypothetical protein